MLILTGKFHIFWYDFWYNKEHHVNFPHTFKLLSYFTFFHLFVLQITNWQSIYFIISIIFSVVRIHTLCCSSLRLIHSIMLHTITHQQELYGTYFSTVKQSYGDDLHLELSLPQSNMCLLPMVSTRGQHHQSNGRAVSVAEWNTRGYTFEHLKRFNNPHL